MEIGNNDDIAIIDDLDKEYNSNKQIPAIKTDNY